MSGAGLTTESPGRVGWACALGLALCAAPGALAQAARPDAPPVVRPRLSVLADSVSPGERVRVAVAVDPPPGMRVVFPDVPRRDGEAAPLLTFGDAEALGVRRLPPRLAPVRTDSALYDVAVFASGTAHVGPVEVMLVQAVGARRDTLRIATGVARLPVRSRLGGEPPGAVAPPPVGPPEAFSSPAPLLVAVGGLAALALVALGRRRRRRRPVASGRAGPRDEALARLDTAASLAPDAAALEAREALRAFLRRRLGLPAPARASDETAALLAADPRVPPGARAAALRTFATADPTAYAAARPDADDARAALADARAAIDAVDAQADALARADPPPPAGPLP